MIYRTNFYRTRLFNSKKGPWYKILGSQNFLNSSPYCPVFFAAGSIAVLAIPGYSYPFFSIQFEEEEIHLPDIWEVRKFWNEDGDKVVSILIEGILPLRGATRWEWERIKRIVFILEGSFSPFEERKKCFEKFKQKLSSPIYIDNYESLTIHSCYFDEIETENKFERCSYSRKNAEFIKFHDYLFHLGKESIFLACNFEAIFLLRKESKIFSKNKESRSFPPGTYFLVYKK